MEMENEIRLYGPIGGRLGYSAEEIIGQIPQGATEITVRIHSPGGTVGDGVAIYNALRDHPATVTTIVDGDAHSAATLPMLAASPGRRLVHKSSRVLIHNASVGPIGGNASELRSVADRLDETDAVIMGIYEQQTGMTRDALTELMQAERFMNGGELNERGFADVVIDDEDEELEIAAMFRVGDKIAAQVKEEDMSKQLTRKDLEAKAEADAARITELESQVGTLEADGAKSIDEVRAELQPQIDAATEKTTGLETELFAQKELAAAAELERDQIKDELAESVRVVEAKGALIAEHEATIASQKATLESPAYLDAAKTEADKLAQAELDAEADDAEANAKAAAEAKAEADKPTFAKWQAIEDPGEKGTYFTKNQAAIEADVAAIKEDADNE